MPFTDVSVEVIRIAESFPNGDPINVIAVGYHFERRDLESTFRKAYALFDTVIEGMSTDMQALCNSAYHRVAVLELKPDSSVIHNLHP